MERLRCQYTHAGTGGNPLTMHMLGVEVEGGQIASHTEGIILTSGWTKDGARLSGSRSRAAMRVETAYRYG